MSNTGKKTIAILLLIALICVTAFGCAPKTAAAPTDPAAAPADTEKAASTARPEGVPADFPNKPIELIYGFGPGSPFDAYFRIMADKIQKTEGWENGFIVTYKEGASGKIGWSAIANAKPDGYTIGFTPSAMLISSTAETLPYGYDKMSYIMNTMTDPGAIGVVTGSKYKTLQDIVDDAKARPGQVSIGVTSAIGQEGLTLKLIEKAAGVKFKIVPFDGETEVLAAVVGKHVDGFCLNITNCTTMLEEKQIVVVATGDEKRSVFLPDVPTYKESGYEVLQVNMRGIGAPKDMPEPIRKYLENCFIAAAADPEIQKKVEEMKIPVDTLSGGEMQEKYTIISEGLQKLWKEDPWQ